MVRIDRGGSGFLAQITRHLVEFGAGEVYSPALFPGSTRVWVDNDYEECAHLDVFERSLAGKPGPPADHPINRVEPEWESIVAIDRSAFEGFWGMSAAGLEEAYKANKTSQVLTVDVDGRAAGYAIVGVHWGVAYLHRIAVRSDLEGHGLGRSLLAASLNWGSAHGGRVMVLNVRPDNPRARRLYEQGGFADTGTRLSVLRHRAS
jgi:ribosomal-protein-alanine N-acetyltransferase